MEVGTSKVLKYLFKDNFNKFPYSDFEYELNSHPDFPTLKAISDTLEKFGIENVPVKLRPDELEKIDTPFLAYINSKGQKELAYAKPRVNGSLIYYSETRCFIKEGLNEFAINFSGIAVLLNLQKAVRSTYDPTKKKDRQLSKSIVILSLLCFASFTSLSVFNNYSWLFSNINSALLLCTKALGLTLATILVLKDFGQSSDFIDKVCKLGKQANCDQVLESRFATIYGWFKWSDVGFVYFLSSWLILIDGNLGIIALLSFAALPYVFISLYQQVFILKKLCSLCLGILTVLLIEFSIGLSVFSNFSLETSRILNLAILITSLSTLYLTTKALILSRKTKTELEYQYNRLKRNSGVIKEILKKEKQLQTSGEPKESLQFGSLLSNALQLQVILSLDCVHCQKLFSLLDEYLSQNYNISIELFLVFNMRNKKHIMLMEELLKDYSNKNGQKAWNKLSEWYKKADQKKLKVHDLVLSEDLKKLLLSTNSLIHLNQIDSFPKLFIEGIEKSRFFTLKDYVDNTEQIRKSIYSLKRTPILNNL